MRAEIGGYLELERFYGSLYHDEAIPVGSGRAALACLIRSRGLKRLALPDFLCDAVESVCSGLELVRYPIGPDLRPAELPEDRSLPFYLVNYYGQLRTEEILALHERYPRLILDNAQDYFRPALPGIDSLVTCRKFLGVADGGFLYTESDVGELERDESHERMAFVLGRFERPAGEFFTRASENNDLLPARAVAMSDLTENLLRAIDYDEVIEKRTENFSRLHRALQALNRLELRETPGPYAYPLRIAEGAQLRRFLIEKRIFVPCLWPNVTRDWPPEREARRLAEEIVPLPCDQRYGEEETDYMLRCIRDFMKRKGETPS